MAPTRSTSQRLRRRTVFGSVIAVAVVVAVAGAAFAFSGSLNHAYRTAIVTPASVTQTLDKSGTIEPVAQATVGFPMGGTVASVNVQAGQAVVTGEVLASLNTTALQQTLAEKQAALAAAQLTLQKALNGESVSSGASNSSRPSSTSSATAASTVSASVSSTSNDIVLVAAMQPSGGKQSGAETIPGAQRAVLQAQQAVDRALSNARASLAAASTACAAGAGGGSTTSTPPTTAGGPSTSTPTTTPNGSGPTDCVAAQQQALRDEQTVEQAQQTLAQAENTLDFLLAASANSNGAANSNGGSTSGTGGTGGANRSSATGSGGSVNGTQSAAPTAEQLVAYQATVDAAQSDVAVAMQSLAQATIVSPINGRVAQVNVVAGGSVTAGASTDNVIVVGDNGYEVATTITVDDLEKVTAGDVATVIPDGGQRVAGKVVSIGVAADTSGGDATYTVVIGFTAPVAGLRNGASASVQIQVAKSKVTALTVPTSAVQTLNGVHVVTVLANGKTSTVRVTIGAVGAARTEITSGLRAGQVVVLADLHAALPSSNTNTRSGGFGGGGLGGGGLGGNLRGIGGG